MELVFNVLFLLFEFEWKGISYVSKKIICIKQNTSQISTGHIK